MVVRHSAQKAFGPLHLARFALPGFLLGTALTAVAGLAVLPAPAGTETLVAASSTSAGLVGMDQLQSTLAPPIPVPVVKAAPKVVARPTPQPTRAAAQKRVSRSRSVAPAQPAETTGGYACPVAGRHSFSDTWGEARSGGRRHQGTDVMAAYGTPVAAVTSGVVRTAYSSAGGISLYLDGNDGVQYFYAHNSRNSVRSGQRVKAGEIIAAVGTSGNAPDGAPHVHFERHVGGSTVNPYTFLRRIC